MIVEFVENHMKYKKGDKVDVLRTYARELVASGVAMYRNDIATIDTVISEPEKTEETQHITVHNHYYENAPMPEKLGFFKRILQKFKIA
jgi:hypothetical protein